MSDGAADRIAFDTLIYTDCRPGQGLQGSAGLQFQARSPGADKAAMAVVQRSLLYEAPTRWMRERRPVSDYPLSFAHAWDGVYATAAGVYLGKEANGSREGNQLTHSIVARTGDAYGLVRPAQLFGAPFWTHEPAESTTSAPILDGWSPGPFDAFAARDLVENEPHGPELAITLVSAFERIGGDDERRVLFIAKDPQRVLHWIAAATLLLPQRKALAIGFKVFTTNPAYATQPVVAIHPEWDSNSVSVESDAGYIVVDLLEGRFSAVEPSPTARRLVALLRDEDPYDVVDVVEVAAASEQPPQEALELGMAMVLPHHRLTTPNAQIAVSWLRRTSPQLLATHRGALVDQLTTTPEQWPQHILLELDEISRSGQVPPDRVGSVRLSLIRAEVDTARRTERPTGLTLPPLPPDVWQPHRRAAEEIVADALTDGVTTGAFDAILRVAYRFGLTVRLNDLRDTAHAFVVDWASRPERNYPARSWPCGEELEHALRDELIRRVESGQAEAVGDAWWRRFIGTLESIHTPLDEAVVSAAMLHSSTQDREGLIRTWLIAARDRGSNPESALHRVVEILWARIPPTNRELRLLCEIVPTGLPLDRHVYKRLVDELNDGALPLSRDLLDLAKLLIEHGIFQPSATEPVHLLLTHDAALEKVCEKFLETPEDEAFDRLVADLEAAGDRSKLVWQTHLVDKLIRVNRTRRIPAALGAFPRAARESYLTRLSAAIHRPGDPIHALAAFRLVHDAPWLDQPDRDELQLRLRDWMARSERRRKHATEQVDAWGKPWPDRWAKHLSEAGSGPRLGWLRRGKG